MPKDVTLRLSDETAARLEASAQQAGRSLSEVGARSIEEWLRQNEFVQIEFRSFGSERHACLKGALQIWQLILVAQEYDLDVERTAAHFRFPSHRIQAAFDYYVAYPEEIDRAIAENRAISFDEIKRLLPHATFSSIPTDSGDSEARS